MMSPRVCLLIAGVVLLACDGDGSGRAALGSHVLRYPLVAHEADESFRGQVEGDLETAWIQFGGVSARALVARGTTPSASLSFRLEALAGGELRVRIGLFATRPGGRGTARFRVGVLHSAQTEPFLDLFDSTLQFGQSKELRLPIPEDAVRIRLDVSRDAEAIAAKAWPVWLEPTLEREAPRPIADRTAANLLLVTVDTLRADVLSSYGGDVDTPSLESLVDDGVRFVNAHSVALGTTPSHASILTSRPASRHGVTTNRKILRRKELTLAEVLASRGYHTGAFVSGIPLSRRHFLDQGFDIYEDAFIADHDAALSGTARSQRRADRTREQFEAWLAGIPPDEPTFAWVHLFDPHQPYDPPRWTRRSGSLPTNQLLKAGDLWRRGEDSFRAIADDARERYAAEVAFVDEELGRVLERMLDRGSKTVVVFAADHGETFLDRDPRLAFNHTTLHREVTRIPLVIAIPGQAAGDTRRFDPLVASSDIAPTVLGLLGVPVPESFEGVNLMPWLSGPPPAGPPHDYLVIEGAGLQQIAVRTEHWLYREVRTESRGRRVTMGFAPEGVPQLYDLDRDPASVDDLVAERADVAERLARLADASPSAAGRGSLEVAPEHRAALETLGYVDP